LSLSPILRFLVQRLLQKIFGPWLIIHIQIKSMAEDNIKILLSQLIMTIP